MTLLEFKNQFEFLYQSSAGTAPDINSYEISLLLTKAVDELINASILNGPDKNEYDRRFLQPLIVPGFNLEFIKVDSEYKQFNKYIAYLPKDLRYSLRETLLNNKCLGTLKIVTSKIDYFNEDIINPFRRPKADKVLKLAGGSDNKGLFNTYYISKESNIDTIKLTYIKQNKPIILDDLSEDMYNIGDETLKGLKGPCETEISEEFHQAIVDLAVAIADKTIKK